MNIKTAALAFFASMTVGSVVTVAAISNSDSILALAQECDHVGNHYTQLDANDVNSGTKEYWVCCKCHEHFLSQPEPKTSYTWNDAGVASRISDSSDDRYIPAVTNAPSKDDVQAFTNYLNNLGFGTVSYDEATGTYNIGNFSKSTKSESIIIPEGVSNIDSTFKGASTLKYLVIPEGCELPSNAFSGCNSRLQLFFVGRDPKNKNWTGVSSSNIYEVLGTGWHYVDGTPVAL